MTRTSFLRTYGAEILVALGVALAVNTAFADVIECGFLDGWDDDFQVTRNPFIRSLDADALRWMFTDLVQQPRYAPLAWLNYALLYAMSGLDARVFHLQGLVFHIGNALLVLAVARALLGRCASTRLLPRTIPLVAAAAAALLWALHPLRVEPVAWVTGVRYVLSPTFALLAVLAYLRAAPDARDRPVSWRWMGCAAVLASLSVLLYAVTLGLVAVLLVLDVFLLRRLQASTPRAVVSVLVEKLPFVAAPVLVLALTLFARFHTTPHHVRAPTLEEFGLGPRVMQALYMQAHTALAPLWPFELSPVYTTLIDFDPGAPRFLAAAGFVAGSSAACWYLRRRAPGLAAWWVAHVIITVPVLGLTEQPHFPADRYTYVPGILSACALAWVLARLAAHGRAVRVVLVALVLGSSGALALSSHRQVQIWRSSETLLRFLMNDLEGDPYQPAIAWRLGAELLAQGRPQEAIAALDVTLAVDPDAPIALRLKADALDRLGDLEGARTLRARLPAAPPP